VESMAVRRTPVIGSWVRRLSAWALGRAADHAVAYGMRSLRATCWRVPLSWTFTPY
jgi:hypothetical protein